jgi:hypothetical protein
VGLRDRRRGQETGKAGEAADPSQGTHVIHPF